MALIAQTHQRRQGTEVGREKRLSSGAGRKKAAQRAALQQMGWRRAQRPTTRWSSQAVRPHIWSIMTCPKPEQLTCVAPSMRRAKS